MYSVVATKGGLVQTPSSPLTLARPLKDLGSVAYPAGISSPNPELNAGAKEGKFRYDRDFLLQFMLVCKEKPKSLPPLDAIGLGPVDQLSLTRGGSGRSRQLSGTSAPSQQASMMGGGVSGTSLSRRSQYQRMGQFTISSSKFGPGSERIETGGGRPVCLGGASVPFHNPGPPMQRTPSGPGGSIPSHQIRTKRTRTKRGEKRTDPTKPTGPQAHGPVYSPPQGGFSPPAFEHVAPLQTSESRWDRKTLANSDSDAPNVVDRKVKALLNKLTMEKFDSISDQIIQWANRSETQKDGRTLIQVIRLVVEKATDEATWSEMYARLCRKMMEQISTNVHDEGIKTSKGKPIAGGQLFRKYLLSKCQEDSERGWVAKEAVAATKAKEDRATEDANERNGSGEVDLYSDDYCVAQKAKRQGLGLIKFIGELFKLQMLKERMIHQYIKKLLGNVHDHGEGEIESLCTLMTTVGSLLDTQRGRAHMDTYFQRMKELTQNLNVSPQMQFMLQDVLDLRKRKWISRNAAAGPATLAQIRKAATNEKAAQGEESTDVKEFFSVRNLDEAEVYFSTLPSQYHHSLVNKLVSSAVESKEPDARLVADLFTRAKSKGLCSPGAFEEGFTPTAEIIEDIAIDAPKAWTLFATIINGAKLDEEHRMRLASKSTDSDKLLGLLSS